MLRALTGVLGVSLVLVLASNAGAAVTSPLNGGFETPAPDPAYSNNGGVLPGSDTDWRSDENVDNWDANTTLEIDAGIMSHADVSQWRYGGVWSPYAVQSGESLLGMLSKHDWAHFGGVQQDLGTMDNEGDKYDLAATVYGHVHSDQNTIWGTTWENCDAAMYRIVFYNATDGVVLTDITEADFPVGFKGGYLGSGPDSVAVSMEYTAQASDVGDTLRLLLLPRDPGAGLMSQVGVDDVTVVETPIPEPMTLALLGIGGLAALIRRRR